MQRINDFADVKQAVENSSWGVAAVAGTKIDGTGFSRARFVFSFGANGGTSAALSTGAGVWEASTSGATFTSINGGSMVAVTSGVLSKNVMVIDTVIGSASPWLLVSNMSILSTAINMSCVVELYRGVGRPPSSSAQQLVVI